MANQQNNTLGIGAFILSREKDGSITYNEINLPFFRSLADNKEKPITNELLRDSLERGEVMLDIYG